MSLFSTLSADQVAHVIAGQRRSGGTTAVHSQIMTECIQALPNARADSPVDALALLVSARQVVETIAAPYADTPALKDADRSEALEWSGQLIGRVIAMLEDQTGIASESYTGTPPNVN